MFAYVCRWYATKQNKILRQVNPFIEIETSNAVGALGGGEKTENSELEQLGSRRTQITNSMIQIALGSLVQ